MANNINKLILLLSKIYNNNNNNNNNNKYAFNVWLYKLQQINWY